MNPTTKVNRIRPLRKSRWLVKVRFPEGLKVSAAEVRQLKLFIGGLGRLLKVAIARKGGAA